MSCNFCFTYPSHAYFCVVRIVAKETILFFLGGGGGLTALETVFQSILECLQERENEEK